MASLSIRKLEDETLQRLRIRAAQHRVSMEEEVRRILRLAVMPPERLGELAQQFLGEQHGVELNLPTREVYLDRAFEGRILDFTTAAASHYAQIMSHREIAVYP